MEKKNDYCLEKDCANYLKSKNINSFLEDLKKKYKSYGEFKGSIKIRENERDAITGIVGFRVGSSLKVSTFTEGINKTRFAGVDLLKTLRIYFDENIETNKQIKINKSKEVENIFNQLLSTINKSNPELKEWLHSQFENKNKVYQILLSEDGEQIIDNILIGLDIIRNNVSYLPMAIFASNVTGNPHYFDKDSNGDKLLLSVLSFLNNQNIPTNSLERKKLLSKFNLSSDEIAGNVVLYQVELNLKNGIHKGAYYTYLDKQPFVCSKANLKDVVSLGSKNKRIYAVENEMVFSYLQKHLISDEIGLICTSGQLSSTAKEVIELLIKEGNCVYYAGDIDPEGVLIAHNLKTNYKNINYWHMSKADYLEGLSEEEISDKRLVMLDKIDDNELIDVVNCLKDKKLAAYQENILDSYLNDLNKI